MSRIVVDLPAPFGLRKPVTTPGSTSKVRSSAVAVALGEVLGVDHGVFRLRMGVAPASAQDL
jgi:hypothetical protein